MPAQYRAVELFCGAGGLALGLHAAGVRTVAAADRDPDALATFARNFPGAVAVHRDLSADGAIDELAAVAGGCDVVAGGPPCQGFSQTRGHSRVIDDPRNRLYRLFVTAVSRLNPGAFIMENVPGMAQIAGGAVLEQILDDLRLSGRYRVAWASLNAADFGAPQARQRLVVIGSRSDLRPPYSPEGTGLVANLSLSGGQVRGDRDLARILADPCDLRATTARQALSDLEQPGDRYGPATSAYQRLMRERCNLLADHQPARSSQQTVTRLRRIPPGGNLRDIGGGGLRRTHFNAYRRLHPDWPAWTLNTKSDCVYHYAQPRSLSVREFARLQGFPDDFEFVHGPADAEGRVARSGPRNATYRMIGNAVPVQLARAAAVSAVACLA